MIIDRVSPTRRPPGRAAMRMTWADLGFLHWEVAAAALRPLVPDALEIDTFEGRAFVGLVPFTMRGVRPAACLLRYEPAGPASPAPVDTLEHFLVERYLLYAFAGGTLFAGRVHHGPYPLQAANVDGLDESLFAACGVARPASAPLAHYARGVEVDVFPLQRAT